MDLITRDIHTCEWATLCLFLWLKCLSSFSKDYVVVQEGGESVGMDENVDKWEGVGHQSMGD